MTRTPQVAVAVLALIAVPGVVGAVTKPATTTPEPSKTSLDVELSSDERRGDNMALLRVMTDGRPPRAGAVSSVAAESGLHPAVVRSQPITRCTGLKKRYATSARPAREWCLQLAGITDGRKVSGSVKGLATTLELTANRRAPFFWLPFMAGVGGLGLGMLVVLVPRWLRSKVRRGLLDKRIADNEQGPEDEYIAGLREWVDARRAANVSDDAILPVVDSVIELGPPAARRARADLAAEIAATTLPSTHSFIKAATAVSGSSKNAVGDFLKDDGTARTPHPVREWIAALDELEIEHMALDRAQREIDALDSAVQADPQAVLTTARAVFAAAKEPPAVEAVCTARQEVEIAIEKAKQARPRRGFLVAGLSGSRVANLARVGTEIPGLGQRLFAAGALGRLWLVTAALILLVVAWAVLALQQTVYAPNAAFGTSSDYLALLTAALGSGAAGSVLALAAIWDPSSPAAEE